MSHLSVPITLLTSLASLPEYATDGAAGMDLSAAIAEPMTVAPGGRVLVPCGFSIAVPVGYEAQIRPRSGLAVKHGLTVLNAPGTIDADYRGEVKVILVNHGSTAVAIEPGMRIAQMVVAAVERVVWHRVDKLTGTARGDGGFGHTGE